jgi:UDPglucose 6-dehydrogenase
MKISIFGLGYVGTTNAACLAEKGHKLIGVDIKSWKVSKVNNGLSPVREEGLDEKILTAFKKGKLRATTDTRFALFNSDVSFICVGTPSTKNGAIDLSNLIRVIEDVSMILREKKKYHLLVIRSTIVPGTTEQTIIPLLLRNSGKTLGKDIGICVNPEFLREGSMVKDFMNPGLIVIGELDKRSGDILQKIYKAFGARIFRVNIRTAEMVKYMFNAFHGVKVSFINEIANICAKYQIDSHLISEILCSDNKLNISPKYLKPGFAFGGSCIPKDLRALIYQAKQLGIRPILLESALQVNEQQIQRAFNMAREILDFNLENKKMAIIGVAFKEKTDDIRSSPAVCLIKKLLDSNVKIKVYDPMASNNAKKYFENKIEYSETLAEALKDVDLCIIVLKYVNAAQIENDCHLMTNKNFLDLVGIDGCLKLKNKTDINYIGIAW